MYSQEYNVYFKAIGLRLAAWIERVLEGTQMLKSACPQETKCREVPALKWIVLDPLTFIRMLSQHRAKNCLPLRVLASTPFMCAHSKGPGMPALKSAHSKEREVQQLLNKSIEQGLNLSRS